MQYAFLAFFGFLLFSGPTFASARFDKCAAELLRAAEAFKAAVEEKARLSEDYAKAAKIADNSRLRSELNRWIRKEFEMGKSQEEILSTRILGSSLTPSVQLALVQDIEQSFLDDVQGNHIEFEAALRNYIGLETELGIVGGVFAKIGDLDGMFFLSERQDEFMNGLTGDTRILAYLQVSKRALRRKFGEEHLQSVAAELKSFGFTLAD